MSPDLWSLYEMMFKSRTFEEKVRQIWKDGKISGEMHLGLGEEAINAGVVSQLIEGDALALEHRGTAPLLMRGVDLLSLLREFMGKPDGLCGGLGGHMHLFSPEKLAACSSGCRSLRARPTFWIKAVILRAKDESVPEPVGWARIIKWRPSADTSLPL